GAGDVVGAARVHPPVCEGECAPVEQVHAGVVELHAARQGGGGVGGGHGGSSSGRAVAGGVVPRLRGGWVRPGRTVFVEGAGAGAAGAVVGEAELVQHAGRGGVARVDQCVHLGQGQRVEGVVQAGAGGFGGQAASPARAGEGVAEFGSVFGGFESDVAGDGA